jgi:IS5 family transposase
LLFDVLPYDGSYRGLAKNTHELRVMFALSNLWMVRKRILQGAVG